MKAHNEELQSLLGAAKAQIDAVINEFESADVASLVWACGVLRDSDAPSILRRIHHTSVLNQLQVQELVNVAWALAKLGASNSAVAAVLAQRSEELSLPQLANVAWALAKSSATSTMAVTCRLTCGLLQSSACSPQDLANLV